MTNCTEKGLPAGERTADHPNDGEAGAITRTAMPSVYYMICSTWFRPGIWPEMAAVGVEAPSLVENGGALCLVIWVNEVASVTWATDLVSETRGI